MMTFRIIQFFTPCHIVKQIESKKIYAAGFFSFLCFALVCGARRPYKQTREANTQKANPPSKQWLMVR